MWLIERENSLNSRSAWLYFSKDFSSLREVKLCIIIYVLMFSIYLCKYIFTQYFIFSSLANRFTTMAFLVKSATSAIHTSLLVSISTFLPEPRKSHSNSIILLTLLNLYFYFSWQGQFLKHPNKACKHNFPVLLLNTLHNFSSRLLLASNTVHVC